MSDITLITPPDKVFNQGENILLIFPSEESKQAVQLFLSQSKQHFNVYLYTEDTDIDWLLSVHKFCGRTFLELDNIPPELNKLVSYFISFPTTYWLTKGEHLYYNKLSVNRIYNFDFLNTWIGGVLSEEL
jgi:hypothetical protein|tara:strand:- start:213 stop:602 length:390 start_codon:yes stop_codon:yes gene_type:complete